MELQTKTVDRNSVKLKSSPKNGNKIIIDVHKSWNETAKPETYERGSSLCINRPSKIKKINANGDTRKIKTIGLTDANNAQFNSGTNSRILENLNNNKILTKPIDRKSNVPKRKSLKKTNKQIIDKDWNKTAKLKTYERGSLLSIDKDAKIKEINANGDTRK